MKLTAAERASYAAILLLALALRFQVGMRMEYEVHPDEVCDYLDVGFRIVNGYGCHPWTIEHGMRSYLFPGLIAGVIWLAGLFSDSQGAYLGAVAGFMGLLSLSIVASAIAWGRRTGGYTGAVIAGFMAATWFEMLYYASHTLSEVLATNFLVVAAVIYREDLPQPPRAGLLAVIGLLLGLTVSVRIQLAPAVGVLGLWMWWRHGGTAMLRTAAWAVLPVLATGLLDWATYRFPFQSFVMYLRATTSPEINGFFPTFPVYYYLNVENFHAVGVFPALVLAIALGGRRHRMLLALTLIIFVSHSLVALKLPRYIYPAIPFALMLVSAAVAEALAILTRTSTRRRQAAALVAVLLTFGASSVGLAREGPFSRNWYRHSGAIKASRAIAALPDICGVASWRIGAAGYAGYARLRHDVPFYMISKPERFEADAASFNALLANDDAPPPGQAFTSVGCWFNGYKDAANNQRVPTICLWTRPGQCRPGAEPDPEADRPPGW